MARFTMEKFQRGEHLALLREHGLTPGHMKTLSILDPEQPRPMGVMADMMHCDASQVTWLVDRLEERGFVERRSLAHRPPGEDDRPDARGRGVPRGADGAHVRTAARADGGRRRHARVVARSAGAAAGAPRRLLVRAGPPPWRGSAGLTLRLTIARRAACLVPSLVILVLRYTGRRRSRSPLAYRIRDTTAVRNPVAEVDPVSDIDCRTTARLADGRERAFGLRQMEPVVAGDHAEGQVVTLRSALGVLTHPRP